MMFGNLRSPLRRIIRLVLLPLWMLLWYPPFWLVHRFDLPGRGLMVRLFSRGMNAIMGVKIVLRGELTKKRPVLFVANHASYFDIFALGAVLPAVFIAKDEIPDWPVVGPITRFSGTLYISRKATKTADNLEAIKESGRKSFILFPEGTTSDGNRVKKFNSSFLELARGLSGGGRQAMTVQPVSIAYTRICNIPMGHHFRPYFSWFGDMELAPHVMDSFSFGGITAEITIHPPCPPEIAADRKALAAYCEQVIGQEVSDLLTGRKPKAKAA